MIMENFSIIVLAYLITGGMFVVITLFKVIKFIVESDEKDLTAVIAAKKDLFNQTWKICAWIYAPISFAFILLAFLIAAISSLFNRHRQ
jgi:hypothetical protein